MITTLSFADAVMHSLLSPTPEEKKARERVEARNRRNKKQDPEEVRSPISPLDLPLMLWDES